MSQRREYRQHSKSILLRATASVFREREALLLIERRRWLRRLAWIACGALLLGIVVGGFAARVL